MGYLKQCCMSSGKTGVLYELKSLTRTQRNEPSAAEMINEAAALMAAEVPADIIADTIHGHPTYSEAFMEACADALKRCIHLPKKA